jgi:Ni,Fe-hydrogenase III large subunit
MLNARAKRAIEVARLLKEQEKERIIPVEELRKMLADLERMRKTLADLQKDFDTKNAAMIEAREKLMKFSVEVTQLRQNIISATQNI